MSKFFLNLYRHRRFRSATCQEQEVLEIYDLGENRQLLMELIGKGWWPSIRRNKLKSRGINSLAGLLYVQRSEAIIR